MFRKIRIMVKRRSSLPRYSGGIRVSATEAAKNFGRLVDRVREERTSYVVERGGTAVVRIGPVEHTTFTLGDFKLLVWEETGASAEYLAAVERAAARHNRPRVRRNPWAR
jgi:hypothetical protein